MFPQFIWVFCITVFGLNQQKQFTIDFILLKVTTFFIKKQQKHDTNQYIIILKDV